MSSGMFPLVIDARQTMEYFTSSVFGALIILNFLPDIQSDNLGIIFWSKIATTKYVRCKSSGIELGTRSKHHQPIP